MVQETQEHHTGKVCVGGNVKRNLLRKTVESSQISVGSHVGVEIFVYTCVSYKLVVSYIN